MADIRIRDLPDASPAVPTDFVAIDNGTTRKVPIADLVSVGRPLASQAEAEAGVESTKAMTPLTVKQSIAANAASVAQGVLADSALQPSDVGVTVASAAQGALADSAVQPGDLAAVATSGAYGDLSGRPALASGTEADTGTNSTNLMAPSTTKRAIDNAIGKYGSFAGNTFGNWSITGSGVTSIVQVPGEGFVYQSVGSTILELPMLARVKGRQYQIKARIRTTVNPTVAGQDRVFVGFAMFDNLGARTYSYVAANGVNLPASSGFVEYQGIIDCDTLASSIVQICPRVILNYNAGDGTQQLQSLSYNTLDATKLSTANGVARTSVSRFGDTFDIKEFGFDVSGADASAAANNDAIDRMIAHATANPGMTYKGRKGDVIRITAIGKTFPANTTLYMNGGRFRWSGDISGSASNVLTFGPGFRGHIGFEPVSGSNWRRLLLFNGGTVGSTIEQIDLSPEAFSGIFNNNFDAAVKTDGNNVQIGTFNISKCYIGYMHRGLNGAAFDTGLKIGYLDIKEYGKIGAILQNVDLWLAGYNIREQGTVGLPPDPGYNALQTASISGYIGGGTLANATEHNYRDGGPAAGERVTRDLTIQGMTSKNAGQCCFKMFTGIDGSAGLYRNITLADISALNPRARAGAGGFNDFGFMLQQMVDSRAHGLSCTVEGSNPKAGMYISGPDNLQIDGYQFRQSSGIAASNAIWISEYNGDATGTPQACNGLGIKNIYAQGHAAEGVRLEFPSASIRDMYLSGQLIAGTDGIGPAPAAARFAQLSRFELLVRGNSGTKFNLPVTANVVTKDLTTP